MKFGLLFTTVFVVLLGGCLGHNGWYNANTIVRRAEIVMSRGMLDSSMLLYARAAEAAESALLRNNLDEKKQKILLSISVRSYSQLGECSVAHKNLDRLKDLTSESGSLEYDSAVSSLKDCSSDASVVGRGLQGSETISEKKFFAQAMLLKNVDSLSELLKELRAQSFHSSTIDSLGSLLLLLHATSDESGASDYLAGELAFESFHAPDLALSIWRGMESRWPNSPLSARSLFRSAQLVPDSAPEWNRMLLTLFPESSVAYMLRGASATDGADFYQVDGMLRSRLVIAEKAISDTLKTRRSEMLSSSP